MDFVRTYYDVTKEIEILELRLADLEDNLKHARKVLFDGKLPSGDQTVYMPLDKALKQYDAIVEDIRETSDRLTKKKMIRERMEDQIRSFKGLEYQVAYLRDIERMTLKAIAKELKYSEDYIKKVSSRIKKVKSG